MFTQRVYGIIANFHRSLMDKFKSLLAPPPLLLQSPRSPMDKFKLPPLLLPQSLKSPTDRSKQLPLLPQFLRFLMVRFRPQPLHQSLKSLMDRFRPQPLLLWLHLQQVTPLPPPPLFKSPTPETERPSPVPLLLSWLVSLLFFSCKIEKFFL